MAILQIDGRPIVRAGWGLVASALLLSGCASKLQVWEGNAAIRGVPFKGGEVFVKQGVRNKHSEGGDCEPIAFYQTLVLPTGQTYYVNLDAGEFSKSGMTLKLNENGVLSEVTMNSEPSADAMNAATTAASTLLPFLGVTPRQPPAAAAAAPAAGVLKACDVGEAGVRYVELSKFNP